MVQLVAALFDPLLCQQNVYACILIDEDTSYLVAIDYWGFLINNALIWCSCK